jgi:hypothetical protein
MIKFLKVVHKGDWSQGLAAFFVFGASSINQACLSATGVSPPPPFTQVARFS